VISHAFDRAGWLLEAFSWEIEQAGSVGLELGSTSRRAECAASLGLRDLLVGYYWSLEEGTVLVDSSAVNDHYLLSEGWCLKGEVREADSRHLRGTCHASVVAG